MKMFLFKLFEMLNKRFTLTINSHESFDFYCLGAAVSSQADYVTVSLTCQSVSNSTTIQKKPQLPP